jgi:streptogramin lyase
VVTEYKDGMSAGSKPLALSVAGEDLWFSDAGAHRIGKITLQGNVSEFSTVSPNSGPRSLITGPDGNIWFVESSVSAIGRVTMKGEVSEFKLRHPDASPRGVVSANGDLWFTQNFINSIGRMTLEGKMLEEYELPTANSGPRAALAIPGGRIFFSEHDVGKIGELILS